MADLEAHPMDYLKQDLLAGLATALAIDILYRSLRAPTCPPPVQVVTPPTPSLPVVACEDIFTFNNQSRPIGCHFRHTSQANAPIATLLPTPTTENLPTPEVTKSSVQKPPQGFYSPSGFASLVFGWIGSLPLVQTFMNMPIMLGLSKAMCWLFYGVLGLMASCFILFYSTIGMWLTWVWENVFLLRWVHFAFMLVSRPCIDLVFKFMGGCKWFLDARCRIAEHIILLLVNYLEIVPTTFHGLLTTALLITIFKQYRLGRKITSTLNHWQDISAGWFTKSSERFRGVNHRLNEYRKLIEAEQAKFAELEEKMRLQHEMTTQLEAEHKAYQRNRVQRRPLNPASIRTPPTPPRYHRRLLGSLATDLDSPTALNMLPDAPDRRFLTVEELYEG